MAPTGSLDGDIAAFCIYLGPARTRAAHPLVTGAHGSRVTDSGASDALNVSVCMIAPGQRVRSGAMPTPFPGMDPYLEHPALWPDVHNGLIAELRNTLAPQLRPRYYVALEERTYLAEPAGLAFVSHPDVTVVGSPTPAANRTSPGEAASMGVATLEPVIIELPIPELVRETYLEVRLAQTHAVIAVLELLSPANKRPGEGRPPCGPKSLQVLTTSTHWVEIDLLRCGEPMAADIRGQIVASHYRILISRAE